MSIIVRGDVDYCLNDYLNHWLTSFIVVKLSDKTFCLQLWVSETAYNNFGKEETTHNEHNTEIASGDHGVFEFEQPRRSLKSPCLILETRFPLNGCVIGKRSLTCFMRNSANVKETARFSHNLWFLSTTEVTLNLKGENVPYLLHQIQFKRCESQAEVHDYELDRVYYTSTQLGEVDVDETEFLIAVTPSDVSLISLFRRCITRSWSITGIRKFGIVEDTILKLELGKKVQFGDRTYSFFSDEAKTILNSIRRQVNIITLVIKRNSKANTNMSGNSNTNKRHSDSKIPTESRENLGKSQTPRKHSSPPKIVHSTVAPDYRFKFMQNIGEIDNNTQINDQNDEPKQNLVYESVEVSASHPPTYENTNNFFSGEDVLCSSISESNEHLKYDLYGSTEHPFTDTQPCYEHMGSFSSGSSAVGSYELDIYPNVELPYERIEVEKDILYEKISFSLGHKYPRKDSADVNYQDVALDKSIDDKKMLTRRKSKYKLAPTFISYIEGGTKALEKAKYLSSIPVSDDSSGVYNVLYDPRLVSQSPSTSPDKEDIYDCLKR